MYLAKASGYRTRNGGKTMQKLKLLPDFAVLGFWLVSLHFMCNILWPGAKYLFLASTKRDSPLPKEFLVLLFVLTLL